MWDPSDFTLVDQDVPETVRLFPLPNLVLFPGVIQPLHVFEPRYCDLLDDAMQGDRLIALATLSPGWENDYEGQPPLYPMACLGRVLLAQQVEGRRSNILLVGLRRVRLLEEIPPRQSFREARAEVCHDSLEPQAAGDLASLRAALRKAFFREIPAAAEVEESLEPLLGPDVPLGTLTDVISYSLDLPTEEKEHLLAELDVCRRAETLLALLDHPGQRAAPRTWPSGFPPPFSDN